MAVTCNGTVPCIVEGYGARLYYIPYEYGTIIGPEQWWHDYDKNLFYLFVTGYWSVTIPIAIAYVIGVHLLQRSMLNRKPFNLRWPHLIWNACFALFSLMGFIRMSEEILFLLRTRPLLDSISYSWDPHQPVAFWALCCITSKFFALGDTVFIVLRKRPLIFLHWYHHSSVLIASWHSAKECVACTRWFILINFGVASITYAYFAVKIVGIRRRRIVSMAVTMLEIAQMIAGVLISCFVLHYKLQGHVMQQSYENLAIFFTIYITFGIVFTVFFKDAYIAQNDKKIR
ncbi:hypothetical protein PRIPAC_81691 [Pristionchus pacificus]|uniref:Elongation of very long chain fatty acids protein n=1 Tax=Pristionchus pacificus TaxID=54126 RepID=A0A2A6CQ51_PRIPA|nr:hypothetical protein PRIPAC_81691 [Pristionchus pacificus]|eukprot:PDM80345.1 hypothetical protein PRIPAC_32924 [Pristionchus pacificus]